MVLKKCESENTMQILLGLNTECCTDNEIDYGISWHFLLLIADSFGILKTLSGVNCGQFWSFFKENENK